MQEALYVLMAFLAVIVLMRAGVFWRARSAVGKPAPDTAAVDGAASSETHRVYYFYGRHCRPCNAMTPVIDALCRDHPSLIKVDAGQHPDVARRFGVSATPAFVVVENGLIRKMKLGRMSEEQLRDLLKAS
jgi:thioredoxin